MPNFTYCEPNEISLIKQTVDGRIMQVALTVDQHKMLQAFLATISKVHPLVEMGKDHDLVLKSTLPKKYQK